MSERNVELARGAIGSLDRLIDLFDEEVVWDNRTIGAAGLAPLDQTDISRGKQAVTRQVRSWVGTWEDFRFEVDELIDAGDSVALEVRESGRGRGSGAPMEHRYWQLLTFRGERIVRGAAYATRADALEAAEQLR